MPRHLYGNHVLSSLQSFKPSEQKLLLVLHLLINSVPSYSLIVIQFLLVRRTSKCQCWFIYFVA
jgi:hypothetical protein